MRTSTAVFAALGFVAALAGSSYATAVPVVLANGVHTIDLQTDGSGVTPMNVTYDPGQANYYSGRGGNETGPLYVWDTAGNQLQSFTPTGIDLRSLNFNANTGDIEAVTFAAQNGGGPFGTQGLVRMNRTAGGLFQNPNAQILASMPGLPGNQTMPAYNAATNQFYAREGSATVNVVSRVNGSLAGTVNLDVAAAGNPQLVTYGLGYDSFFDVFVELDVSNNRAEVFDINGNFLGQSALAGLANVDQSYGMGYANGQIFVYDGADNRWEGFRIFEAAAPEPDSIALLGLGLAGLGFGRRKKA